MFKYWCLFWWYFTKPLRFCMFWYNDLDFALKLVFWNDYKVAVLYAQSQHETGNFESRICQEYNNYYGMRGAVMENSQSGVVVQGTNDIYPDVQTARAARGANVQTYAIYKNTLLSVYDMYLYTTVRTHTPKTFLDNVPANNFDTHSPSFLTYVANYIGALKAVNYFTAPASSYASRVYDFAYNYGRRNGSFWISVAATPIITYFLLRYAFSSKYRASVNNSVKKSYSKYSK